MARKKFPMGIFAPRLPAIPSRKRLKPLFEEEGYETLDVYTTHDWTLRHTIVLWILEVCQLMVQNRTPKKVIRITNIYSAQHNAYIRTVLDHDCRELTNVYGIRFIITTRVGGDYVPGVDAESALYIHLAKHNRIADIVHRDETTNEILARSQNMYI